MTTEARRGPLKAAGEPKAGETRASRENGSAKPPQHASELEFILLTLLTAHEGLLDAAAEMRRAIAHADARALAAAMARQQPLMQQVADLEVQRQQLVRRIIDADRDLREADRRGAAPPTVTAIISRLPEGVQPRLLELASRLRSTIEQVREAQRRQRLAVESLAAHMQGLIHQVNRRLQPGVTYGPRNAAPAPCGALDVQT